MSGEILLGTASWTDKPLIESGRFYPESARTPEERLRYYASQFPLVEADTTYYGLPQQSMAQNWADRTPEGFTFDVKAYSLFTEHPAPVQRLPKDIQQMLPKSLAGTRNLYRKDAPPDIIDACWSTFIDGVLPLHDRGKLGVVVFQFPKWVFPNRHTWDYFEEIRDRLGPYRAAFEFRNDVWMRADNREDTLARLGDLGFTYICVDEPQGFSSSVPPSSPPRPTSDSSASTAATARHGRSAPKPPPSASTTGINPKNSTNGSPASATLPPTRARSTPS